ncbi:hypothetical protein T484DRAFT_1848712 [Baffinella frigidus]|nr:hypothetical protein T484DRAFT_1848712 [Cryptophyta sp. CCMP2293]
MSFLFIFLFLYVLIATIAGVKPRPFASAHLCKHVLSWIVIDAFGGLRDERDAAEDDLQTTCFVCNLDRFTLDQKGSGFDPHILHEHNPRWYFFFLLHVKSRPKSKLTGQEAYVLEKVWPTDPRHSRSYHW